MLVVKYMIFIIRLGIKYVFVLFFVLKLDCFSYMYRGILCGFNFIVLLV